MIQETELEKLLYHARRIENLAASLGSGCLSRLWLPLSLLGVDTVHGRPLMRRIENLLGRNGHRFIC